jgi:hypothetical protein
VNGLLAGLIEQHGPSILHRIVFKGCNPVIQALIQGAIDLDLNKTDGRVDA